MALIMQSRFAGLTIDDDEEARQKKQAKNTQAKKPDSANKKTSTAKKGKAVSAPQVLSSQANKKKKKKPVQIQEQQWESWKQKDSELVDGHFVDDLEKALLLSKLDYEQQKIEAKKLKVVDTSTKDNKSEDDSKKEKKKGKSKKTVSLEQFNGMNTKTEEFSPVDENAVPNSIYVQRDEGIDDIVVSVHEHLKHELLNEKHKDMFKERQQLSNEAFSKMHFLQVIERKDSEIIELRDQVDKLKDDLHKVKTRNKKLCNILGQGEMKDKAEILIELDKLRSVQDELMNEVESLNQQLQQERSAKTFDNKNTKDKKMKRKCVRFDASTETHQHNE